MSGKVLSTTIFAPLALTGCFHLPARVCLTPPYDVPAGFSETYHAALARQEPILQTGTGPTTAENPAMVIVPGAMGDFVLPPGTEPVRPPMEW